MFAARNRRFAIAVALTGAGWLFLAARGIIEADHFSSGVPGGYVVSTVLTVGVNLVGGCGWLVVGFALSGEIDWRRLLRGGAIVASTYIAAYVASIFRTLAIRGVTHSGDLRAEYVWTTVGALLLAVGACVVASGFADARRGPSRATRIWLGAILATASTAAVTVGQLYQQSFYSSEGALHELTIGTLITAIGALGLTLAALVFVRGARRPITHRESSLAAAAAGAAAASLCIAGGETLIAIAYVGHSAQTWQSAVIWLGLAARLLFVAAFTSLALGARRTSQATPAIA